MIIAIGAAWYVGHKIGRSSSVPGLGKNDTELTLITDRAPEPRLDVMGKKVHAAKPTDAADGVKQEPA